MLPRALSAHIDKVFCMAKKKKRAPQSKEDAIHNQLVVKHNKKKAKKKKARAKSNGIIKADKARQQYIAKKNVLDLLEEGWTKTGKRIKSPHISPAKLAVAIEGTNGNKSEIARRLGLSRIGVVQALARKGVEWDLVRKIYQCEEDRMADGARTTIEEMIWQREDLAVALRASQWILEKTEKKFAKSETLKLEGGENPLQIQQQQQVMNVDALTLSLDTRKALLVAMEAKEKNDED